MKINKSIKIIIIFILVFQLTFTHFAFATPLHKDDLPYTPPEHSKEELYQDIFISLLLPYIHEPIDNYYSKYLTDTPTVAPYTIYVLNAERVNGYRSFVFYVKLKVDSYIGPHLDVGTDYITFIIDGSGAVKIQEFEHIKSYKLTQNYEHIIKKGFKNPIP